MGTLYLVRHGQASFGAQNYDVLSPLGQRQGQRLGAYFAEKGLQFEAVLCGTLQRHTDTCAAIAQGAQAQWQPQYLEALNEFDSEALIAAIHPHPLERPSHPREAKQHFRLLRDGLTQWMAGVVSPAGMPSYDQFAQGVSQVLAQVRAQYTGDVLLVSSGGPISTAIGLVLGIAPEQTITLNYRIRNSAVTEMAFNPKRCELHTFNTLPHLDAPQYADWVSYA
ncbi:MAG: histidine phosphatase family protein [Rhodoferax sp.]